MRIPATLFFGQTFRPYILLFAEIWQGSGGHVVFQNRQRAFYNLPCRAYRPAGDNKLVNTGDSKINKK